MTSPKHILIIGGYGEAGKRIAEILLSQTECYLTIAGRNENKALICKEDLSRNYDSHRLKSRKIDIQTADFSGILKEFSLLIMALPIPVEKVKKLIQALLEHRLHYIDLSPSLKKSRLFKLHQASFKEAGLCCILDAGADPGLPGLVARRLAEIHPSPENLEVAATYRSDEIGQAGAEDILCTDTEAARFFRKGYWRKVSPVTGKVFQFPDGFGKRLSLPLYLEEYRQIPADFPLEKMQTYHTAYNLPANLVFLLYQILGERLFPLRIAASWFRIAIRKFTPKPFGVAIVAQVRRGHQQLQLQLWHHDLYHATAVPVALCARNLLEKKLLKRGCFFMCEAVDSESFIKELIPFGFKYQFEEYTI